MKLKDLDRITNYYNKIKELDESINKLEKLLISVSEGVSEFDLLLNVIDFSIKEKEEKKNLFDVDGSLINTSVVTTWENIIYGTTTLTKSKPLPRQYILNETKLSNAIGIELIGVVLKYRFKERESLLNNLKKLNVNGI